jgi:hypothetical protein
MEDLMKEYKHMNSGYLAIMNMQFSMFKASMKYMTGYMDGFVNQCEENLREANRSFQDHSTK